jgi:DNA-binding NarL/FixJ family response regulator
MTIPILLVDDHTLVRAGFRSLLESMPDVKIVAEANNGLDALELVREHEPALVLMDIAMPRMNGLQTTEKILNEFPKVRVLLLSMYTNEEYVLEALRIGATGYLLKDAEAVEFEQAIRAVAAGGVYLCPSVSKYIVRGFSPQGESQKPQAVHLTHRQQEILRLIADGRTTKEIASILGITLKTVETHRSRLMDVLDIHNVAGLVRYAIRTGLIKSDK